VVIPQGGAEGVLLAQGGNTGGYTFFVKDQRLHFLYNHLGRDKFWLHSARRFRKAKSSCATSSSRPASPTPPKGWGCRPAASSTSTASWLPSIDMPFSVLNLWGTEGLTCGYDGGDRVAPDYYGDAFRFTGTIKRVTLDLSGELIPDSGSRHEDRHGAAVVMARQ
jgi:hypothetical protein